MPSFRDIRELLLWKRNEDGDFTADQPEKPINSSPFGQACDAAMKEVEQVFPKYQLSQGSSWNFEDFSISINIEAPFQSPFLMVVAIEKVINHICEHFVIPAKLSFIYEPVLILSTTTHGASRNYKLTNDGWQAALYNTKLKNIKEIILRIELHK
jgi:hypothetical protein